MTPRSRFILRFGVLAYGGGLFVIFNALHIMRLRFHGASLSGLLIWLLVTGAVSVLFGYAFGLYAWHRMSTRRR